METASGTLKWTEALDQAATLGGEMAFLTRVASQVNQRPVAMELAQLLDGWRNFSVCVTVVGKTESGAPQLAQQIAATFGSRLTTNVIETADYVEVSADAWNEARKSAAVVWVVPSSAPLYDETQETLAREFADTAGKLFLALAPENATEDAIVAEIRQLLSGDAKLRAATVSAGRDLPAVLERFLTGNYLEPLLSAMRAQIWASLRRLQPVVDAFAGFLAMEQADFAQRLEYIRRDVSAVQSLGQQAEKTLETRSQAAMSGVSAQIVSLSATMVKQAEKMVQGAVIPHEVLSSQDSRSRFGRDITTSARAAGYREFEARVQAIARNLNSARMLLLSDMDQVRAEAEAHLEELQLNLGPELFRTLLKPPLDVPSKGLLDVPLDPGDQFTGAVTESIQLVRQNIPDVPFTSNWAAGRIESLFRAEMAANATAGWSLQTVDGPAAAQVAGLWRETAEREAGLLIGRVNTVAGMVQSGLAALRLQALQIPKDKDARATIGRVFGGYAGRLAEAKSKAAQS